MKSKYSIILLLFIVILTGLFSSCGKDRWELYYPQTRQSLWIDSVMREHYLWRDELMDEDELTSSYFLNSVSFLAKVRNADDKVSYVDTAYSMPKTDPGFELMINQVTDSTYLALVTYIEPNSASAIAGIHRGDWIMAMDGKELTEERIEELAEGGTHTLAIGYHTTIIVQNEYDEEEEQDAVAFSHEVTLPAATSYYPEVMPVVDVINDKVGYILYNDIADDNRQKVATASKLLANSGITDMVLDLRFASTGDLQGLQYLASIMAPSSALGTKMATLQYADTLTSNKSLPFLSASELDNGANLNLQTLYVLTSSYTAGPAEMLINCLKAVMNVVVIGQKTQGITLACESFYDPAKDQLLRLAVSELSDANGNAAYAGSGFTPDYPVNPLSSVEGVQPFGSPLESLFAKALAIINGEVEE